MSNKRYAIVVSGQRLTFTKDQIQSEPDNYIATYFFGGSQGDVWELLVEKDIHIFKLIQAHLRGYEILPLAEAAIPTYMTRELALINLFREAHYYGLQRLEGRIKHHQPSIANIAIGMPPEVPQKSTKKYKFAKFLKSGWIINDTTPEGYEVILSNFALAPGKTLMVNEKLKCPGFTQVISWRDAPDDTHSTCALLVSNSPEA